MEILINTKQLKQLKDTYKKKYVDNNELYKKLSLNSIKKDHSWSESTLKYIEIIEELSKDYIIPKVFDERVSKVVAQAVIDEVKKG